MGTYKQQVFPAYKGFNLDYLVADIKRSPNGWACNPNYTISEKNIITDLEMIADLGFNFVRLPNNYLNLISNYDDVWQGDEPILGDEQMQMYDSAVKRAAELGIYVEFGLHTAPGYAVGCGADFKKQPYVLWHDKKAQDYFASIWKQIAERYRGESDKYLGFNLVNEPPTDDGYVPGFTREINKMVAMRAIDAIRSTGDNRIIFTDGITWGRATIPELSGIPNVVLSTRAYDPKILTHFGACDDYYDKITWPGVFTRDALREEGCNVVYDKARLTSDFEAWAKLSVETETGVHCGEGGFGGGAPYDIMIRWFDDVIDILDDLNIGFALWGFCGGEFSIMDSGRKGCEYVEYRGHLLDKKMYEIMKRKI